jgi:hypothetical protein
MRSALRQVVKRHAKDKQSNADGHCNEPTARLCIHDLDPLYFVASRSASTTTIATIATSPEFLLNRRRHLARCSNDVQ